MVGRPISTPRHFPHQIPTAVALNVLNPAVDPHLTKHDKAILRNLFSDIQADVDAATESPKSGTSPAASKRAGRVQSPVASVEIELEGEIATSLVKTHLICGSSLASDSARLLRDQATVGHLDALNDPRSPAFEPMIFSSWDNKTLPTYLRSVSTNWTCIATPIVRKPTDVVFLTHLLMYFATSVPSALLLYYHWTLPHALLHHLVTLWYSGAYTLLLHNHIHNKGVLSREWRIFDRAFPYVLSPLMGHTWTSYYYHHLKMHHVEGNGPGDLSSTIRYQRDNLFDFLQYVGRFLLLVWIELPLYFLRKGQVGTAARFAFSEVLNLAIIFAFFLYNPKATTSVFILPLIQLRIGLMIGNFGQHALVDEEDPNSDFRSSITLIDVPSNRYCFNDGFHTSHHLNPRRHWRDHPSHFIKNKERYSSNGALVFKDIDYLMMTVRLLRKDYEGLARCMVPISAAQRRMTQDEICQMLRRKTRKFTETEIALKFSKHS